VARRNGLLVGGRLDPAADYTDHSVRGIISMYVSVPSMILFILFAPVFTATVQSKYRMTLPVTFRNRFTKVNSSYGKSPVGLCLFDACCAVSL